MNTFCKSIILAVSMSVLPVMIGATTIQEVTVKLQSANSALPPFLQKRMEAGVHTVGEHVLLGKDTEDIDQQISDYEMITSDIIGRVLYGYDVQNIKIRTGKNSTIDLTIKPYKDTVQKIDMEVDYGNLSLMSQELLKEDIKKIKPQIEQILLGASLDAFDWINSVTEKILRERLSDELPEFTTKVSIEPGKTTKVRVFLIPQGDIVRKVDFNFESKTLPKLVFTPMQKKYQNKYQELTGLPVDYLKRRVLFLETQIQKDLQESKAHKVYQVDFKTHIKSDSDTEIIVDGNSDRYVIQAAVAIDMGKEENNVNIKTHLGYNRTSHQEIFLESEFYPGDYKWKIYPSWSYKVGRGTRLAYQYELNDKQNIVLWQQELGKDVYLRVKRWFPLNQYQYGLVYKMDKHMSIEYIVEKEENWLRLVGSI